MSASLDVLRKSLAANGLPTTGNKAEMLARLLNGTGDKRKTPAPKKSAVSDTATPTSGKGTSDPAFLAFEEAERANMSGIFSEEAMTDEIARRWEVLQNLKPKAPSPPTATSANTKLLPVLLDASQMAQAKLTYIGPVDGGMHMYVSMPAPQEEAKVASPKGKARKEAKPDQSSSSTSLPAAGKRKLDDAPIDVTADDEELDMEWACKVTTMRILKKSKKEKIAAFLEDFGVPTRGSKEELAQSLAEQLHYETDEEE